MSVLILTVTIHPLEHAYMRIASMQLLLQGLNDVRVQSSFRLADATVVDLMLTIKIHSWRWSPLTRETAGLPILCRLHSEF